MSIWRIHNVKKWFIISLLALLLIWGIFIAGLCFIAAINERYYVYMVIFFGVYALASIYFLLEQSLFRFARYLKKDGEEMKAVITYLLPSEYEKSSRPLGVYMENGKKKTVALVAMFDRSSKKTLIEGKNVSIYKIRGERLAFLLD